MAISLMKIQPCKNTIFLWDIIVFASLQLIMFNHSGLIRSNNSTEITRLNTAKNLVLFIWFDIPLWPCLVVVDRTAKGENPRF